MGLRDKFIKEIERTRIVTSDNGLLGIKYHLGGSSKVGDKILMGGYPISRTRYRSFILNESQLKYFKSSKKTHPLMGSLVVEKKNRKSKSKKL